MTDSLFARAQLAIEESQKLRSERQRFNDVLDEEVCRLRRAMYDSASARSEIKAHRDNQE
ncbi:hypothetical protein GPL21_30555 [Bradyrhizobium pachyrhizi]|uniref:Uncharacterized protein n=1 Tax=Bradyrhizobium pachyrhizi TaxID=280333 RepID=A0A844T1P6_9BRAD|nr:hypothetical protein [Bradyrhizobium pachyrhizi]MVT69442.1 hypothetical protein [Bradyrhizobium pachyrhizi]